MTRYKVKRGGCLYTKKTEIRLNQKQYWYGERKGDEYEFTRDNVTITLTKEQMEKFFEVY